MFLKRCVIYYLMYLSFYLPFYPFLYLLACIVYIHPLPFQLSILSIVVPPEIDGLMLSGFYLPIANLITIISISIYLSIVVTPEMDGLMPSGFYLPIANLITIISISIYL